MTPVNGGLIKPRAATEGRPYSTFRGSHELVALLRFTPMKFLRPLLALALLLIIIAAVYVWWNLPTKVDMANYAPADSIVYVEFNNLDGVAQAIQHTDVWQAAAGITKSQPAGENRLLHTAARAGIGPLPAVLFARSQIALVVVGLNTT